MKFIAFEFQLKLNTNNTTFNVLADYEAERVGNCLLNDCPLARLTGGICEQQLMSLLFLGAAAFEVPTAAVRVLTDWHRH